MSSTRKRTTLGFAATSAACAEDAAHHSMALTSSATLHIGGSLMFIILFPLGGPLLHQLDVALECRFARARVACHLAVVHLRRLGLAPVVIRSDHPLIGRAAQLR